MDFDTKPGLVLDTNVVIDLLHFLDPRTLWLRDAIALESVRCFTDARCLAELERVLAYPKFGIDPACRGTLRNQYLAWAIPCDPKETGPCGLPRCRDTDDQKFLELALRCHADALITRDKELLRMARRRHAPLPFAILTAETAKGFAEPVSFA
jgi:putative PIN family toxin of toxin-antitoxin system